MEEMCNDLEIEDEKDRIKVVVKRFEFRGGMTTTRSGVLVVPPVLSCPRGLAIVGMVVRGRGSWIVGKRVKKVSKWRDILV